MAERYCTNCGAQLGDEARFCPSCGRPAHETAAVPTPEADVPVPPPPTTAQEGDTPNFAPAAAQPQEEARERNPILMGCLIIVGIVVVLSIIGTCGGGGSGGGNEGEEPNQEQAAQQGGQGDQSDQASQREIEEAQQQAAEAEKEAEEARKAQEAAEQARKEAEEEREAAEQQAQEEAEQKRAEEERKAAEEQARQEAAAAAAEIGETVRAGDAEWTVTYATRANELRQKGFGQFGDTKQGNFVIMDFTFTNLASESVTLDTISLPLYDSQGREYEADTDTFGYIPPQKDIFLNQVNPGVTQEGRIIYSVAPDASGFTVHAGDLSLFGTKEAKIKLGF